MTTARTAAQIAARRNSFDAYCAALDAATRAKQVRNAALETLRVAEGNLADAEALAESLHAASVAHDVEYYAASDALDEKVNETAVAYDVARVSWNIAKRNPSTPAHVRSAAYVAYDAAERAQTEAIFARKLIHQTEYAA